MIGPLLTLMILAAVSASCLLVGSIALVVRWRRVRKVFCRYRARYRLILWAFRTIARFRLSMWMVKKFDEVVFEHLSGSVH